MKIIMFAGAGSVGKTSLMEACMKIADDQFIRFAVHRSTTRATYEKHGFDKEKDALARLDTNRWFQKQVMQDNIDALEATIEQAKEDGCRVLFCDRTPHDYAAYQYTVFSEQMTIHEINEKRHLADYTLQRLWEKGLHDVAIYILPFPAYWSKDTDSSDGWRHDTTGKNFMWSNTVECEVKKIKDRLAARGAYHEHISVHDLNRFAEQSSAHVRAAVIFGEQLANGY